MSQSGDILTVTHLRAYYQLHGFGVERDIRAVDDVSFAVRRGELYGIAGESSCGKSTLIKTVVGAIRPPLNVVGGSVSFSFRDGKKDIYKLAPGEIDAIRWSRLSYVMQGSMSVLNPVRRVRESFVDFASRHMGLDRASFVEAVAAHLARLHLAPEVLDAYPVELSGGMRQRVTIALATVCGPEFIVADEPTTALDVIVQKEVLGLLVQVQRELGASIILVTHDMGVHANVADRVGIMYAGRLVEEAPTAQLFSAPRHPYTAHLIASLPRIGDKTHKESLGGHPPSLAAPPAGCRFHPRCPLAHDLCRREVPPMVEIDAGHRVACFAATGA